MAPLASGTNETRNMFEVHFMPWAGFHSELVLGNVIIWPFGLAKKRIDARPSISASLLVKVMLFAFIGGNSSS